MPDAGHSDVPPLPPVRTGLRQWMYFVARYGLVALPAISAVTLALAVLVGPHRVLTNVLAWVSATAAFAGLASVTWAYRFGRGSALGAFPVVFALAWSVFYVVIGVSGGLQRVWEPPGMANVPAGGTIEVMVVRQELVGVWKSRGKDLTAIGNLEGLVFREHSYLRPSMRVEALGPRAAMIIVIEGETAFRYQLDDIEHPPGRWLEPVPASYLD